MDLIEYNPPALPHDLVERIADAVAIADPHRPQFGKALTGLFDLTRKHHTWDIEMAEARAVIDAEFKDLRKMLTKLKTRLDTLDCRTRRKLGLYALCRRECDLPAGEALRFYIADMTDDGGGEQGERVVSSYRQAVNEMLAGVEVEEWPKRPGAPSRWFDEPGNPNVMAFDIFVVAFVRLVRDRRGSVTLDKNAGTGRLIDVLRIAEPHLPSGLFPDGLLMADGNGKFSGLSRLERLRSYVTGQKRPPK